MMLLCLIQKPAPVAGFLFYVQDVRYAAGAWMRRSGEAQDVRGVFYE